MYLPEDETVDSNWEDGIRRTTQSVPLQMRTMKSSSVVAFELFSSVKEPDAVTSGMEQNPPLQTLSIVMDW